MNYFGFLNARPSTNQAKFQGTLLSDYSEDALIERVLLFTFLMTLTFLDFAFSSCLTNLLRIKSLKIHTQIILFPIGNDI